MRTRLKRIAAKMEVTETIVMVMAAVAMEVMVMVALQAIQAVEAVEAMAAAAAAAERVAIKEVMVAMVVGATIYLLPLVAQVMAVIPTILRSK
jgi:hypothetical protein